MSMRIRYGSANTDTKNVLRSQQAFEVNGVSYRVLLYVMDNGYEVINDATNEVVKTGLGHSLHSIKMRAKQALKELGVSFGSETRNTTKTEESPTINGK